MSSSPESNTPHAAMEQALDAYAAWLTQHASALDVADDGFGTKFRPSPRCAGSTFQIRRSS